MKRNLALGTIAVLGTSLWGFASARADSFTCRDFYAAYVDEATDPAPVVVVNVRPHYHGHYPEYHEPHGGYHGPDLHDGHGHDGHGHDGHDGHDQGNHGNDNNNNSSSSNGDAIVAVAIIGAIAAGLTTTTAVQDAELNDAENVINDIDQAQLGDGAQLRQLLAKVQKKMPAGSSATLAEVSQQLTVDNQNLTFCPAGDLDSESELAASLAAQLSPPLK